MSIASELLKAKHIGIGDFRGQLFKLLDTAQPIVVTEHGHPKSVVLGYDEVLEIIDILEELADHQTVSAVKEARQAISVGVPGIPVSRTIRKFRKIR
jgi:prevent-host-death family protein